jgi:hypothetical protein
MENVDIPKELGRAAIASVVALFMTVFLQALGAGRWLAAAGSGAIGGVVAIAVIA